ncbi:MAG: hypothetical protein AAF318_15040 [Pseudomonadota bacterium]
MTALFAVPLAAAAVLLAVANRDPVRLTADPFRSDPALTVEVPLYLVIFGATAAGVVLAHLFMRR